MVELEFGVFLWREENRSTQGKTLRGGENQKWT